MTDVTVKILLCRDGSKHDIQISQEATLSDLKNTIQSASSIVQKFDGQAVQPRYQRLFYFGRELKSSKRSLSKLGLSPRRNLPMLVHLHSTQPKVVNIDGTGDGGGRAGSDGDNHMCNSTSKNDEDDDEIVLEGVRYAGYKRMNPSSASGMTMGMRMGVNMANMTMGLGGINSRTGSAIGIASTTSSSPTNTTRTIQHEHDVVVLDSDDDDDDDIEVVETRSGNQAKRARTG